MEEDAKARFLASIVNKPSRLCDNSKALASGEEAPSTNDETKLPEAMQNDATLSLKEDQTVSTIVTTTHSNMDEQFKDDIKTEEPNATNMSDSVDDPMGCSLWHVPMELIMKQTAPLIAAAEKKKAAFVGQVGQPEWSLSHQTPPKMSPPTRNESSSSASSDDPDGVRHLLKKQRVVPNTWTPPIVPTTFDGESKVLFGNCHYCDRPGHWAKDCDLILAKMMANRDSSCSMCPMKCCQRKHVIVKVGKGPFIKQWVHRDCAMTHFQNMGYFDDDVDKRPHKKKASAEEQEKKAMEVDDGHK